MTKAILIPVGEKHFVVTNVGKPAFWPHDGDIIRKTDIPWLVEKKGWHVEIKEGEPSATVELLP